MRRRGRAALAAALLALGPAPSGGPLVSLLLSPAPVLAQEAGTGTASSFERRALPAAWDEAISRFADRLAADVAADGVGGMTAAVAVDGALVWARGFGFADRERGIPAGVETVYRTGSISKSITAYALMRLVERGVLALDDPVERFLPEVRELRDPPPGAPPITFRQLASHTAGLIREPELEGAAAGPIAAWEQKVLESIRHTGFRSPPGTEYYYSNIGFGILGLALSRADGRPFFRLVEEEVFRPIGMTASVFIVPPAMAPRLAVGYANMDDGPPDARLPALEHEGRGYKVPNGGVYATAADLARFAAAVTGARAAGSLSASGRDEVLRVQTPGEEEEGYGIGFFLRRDAVGNLLAGHSGSVAGYNAYLAFHAPSGIAVVLLRNYNRGETNLGRAASELVTALIRTGAPTAASAVPGGP